MKKLFFLLPLAIWVLMGAYIIVDDQDKRRRLFPVPSINGHALDTYEDRMRTLEAACQRFASDQVGFSQDVNPRQYMRLDRKHNVAFCPLFKSATSTLLSLFVKMSPDLFSSEQGKFLMHNHRQLHEQTKKKFKYTIIYTSAEGQRPFTFVFVRHPFQRLVSAFEDKLIYNTSPINMKTYSNMRRNVNGSFAKFVDIVLGEKHCLNLKSKCKMNSHWRPFYGSCRHCETTYDMIGRVETIREDLMHLCEKTNITGCKELATEFSNKRMNSYTSHKSGLNKTLAYFKQLSPEKRKALYEFYKLDFEMFGYSAWEYLYLDDEHT